MKVKSGFIFLLTVLLMLNFSVSIFAQEEELEEVQIEEEAVTVEEPVDELQLDMEVLADYFDRYLREQMENYEIPGLAFALVNHGEIITGVTALLMLKMRFRLTPTLRSFRWRTLPKYLPLQLFCSCMNWGR